MGVVKVLAVLMGVLIIIGSTVVVVTIIKRTTTVAESNDAGAAVVLDEPAGTRIGGIAAVSTRLAVLLQGAGPDSDRPDRFLPGPEARPAAPSHWRAGAAHRQSIGRQADAPMSSTFLQDTRCQKLRPGSASHRAFIMHGNVVRPRRWHIASASPSPAW